MDIREIPFATIKRNSYRELKELLEEYRAAEESNNAFDLLSKVLLLNEMKEITKREMIIQPQNKKLKVFLAALMTVNEMKGR